MFTWKRTLIVTLAVTALGGVARAQDGARLPPALREKIRERLDQNHDGKLDADEREAAKQKLRDALPRRRGPGRGLPGLPRPSRPGIESRDPQVRGAPHGLPPRLRNLLLRRLQHGEAAGSSPAPHGLRFRRALPGHGVDRFERGGARTERPPLPPQVRERLRASIRERLDEDGDGTLSPPERAAIRERVQRQRGERAGERTKRGELPQVDRRPARRFGVA